MFQTRKAERRKSKLRMGIVGTSGSGKTYSALVIAKGMGGKVCVLDTESRSADFYSDEFDYDVCELAAPFSPSRYVEAIHFLEKKGYDVIIIDSLTHAWAGEGGALDMLESAKKGQFGAKNSFTAWRGITPEHNKLVNAILQSNAHVLITLRSKSHYDMQENEQGKKVPVKIGLAPIQREGMEYEFTIVLELNQDHYASSSKDRTRLFDGKTEIITEETGRKIIEWLESGIEEVKEEDVKKSNEDITAEIYCLLDIYKEKLKECKTIECLKENFGEGWKEISKFKKYKDLTMEAEVQATNLKLFYEEIKENLK